MKRLQGIDKVRNNRVSSGLFKLEKKLWAEYYQLQAQEELIWFQKARCNWLKWGDRNTKFFHASAKIKTKRILIESLQNDDGQWVEDQETLRDMASDFFRKLYKKDTAITPSQPWRTVFPPLKPADYSHIHRAIEDVEIKNAAFMMNAFKALDRTASMLTSFRLSGIWLGRKYASSSMRFGKTLNE